VNNIKVSANFNLREFQCRCCGAVKLDSELLRRLQAIRTLTGRPMIINSAYRCSTHNRAVKGAANSQHLTGRAADIVISGMGIAQQRKICETYFGDGGIGYANTFTHVDVGPPRRWKY
jgi:zinc D-Ala-D-Ala carboxypeptidase